MKPVDSVLLVDDDQMINMINEKIIQISEFAVRVDKYSDANGALDYLKKIIETDVTKFPAVIFLDIEMPGMNGWKFLEEINKLPKVIVRQCKVFMLTSTTDQQDIEKSKGHKLVHDFISKPLTVEKLEMLLSPKQESSNM